jgi:hypothetical protein
MRRGKTLIIDKTPDWQPSRQLSALGGMSESSGLINLLIESETDDTPQRDEKIGIATVLFSIYALAKRVYLCGNL